MAQTTHTQTLIIVAGGSGQRMQSDIPKQFLLLQNKPILMHAIQAFVDYNPAINIIVVLPKEHIETWKSLCKKYRFKVKHATTAGGETRFESVKNGLELAPDSGLIAVHDGVRPLINTALIERCFAKATSHGTAIPIVDVNESIRKIDKCHSASVDRADYKIVQTPQVFNAYTLKCAYKQIHHDNFTDDASLVEALGLYIHLVEGMTENIKITKPIDLALAEIILQES